MKRKTFLIMILIVLLTVSSALNLMEFKRLRNEQETRPLREAGDISPGYRYMEIINLSDFEDTIIGLDSEGDELLGPTLLIRKKDLEETNLEKEKSIDNLINSAHKLIGRRYVYGDTGKRGYDCSGLTYSLFLNQLGIKIPRDSSAQSKVGIKVDKSRLVPGDLLFFSTSGKGISHVGIYIGEGNMIHASSSKAKVRIDSIEDKYFAQRYVTARRIFY